ncbi:MAG: carboxypeptidase regulatory-like domain-containing protein [Flavobacteriales bacterium]|nr:carboxypeptidase regulatory-like domain-containing protein [Flavobacteriales bacterium]
MLQPLSAPETPAIGRWIAICILTTTGASMLSAQSQLGRSPYLLHISGKVVDVENKLLGDATIAIDTNGTQVAEFQADAKGRFAFDLDIGGFYGITAHREGFVRKRFIVDARTDEPARVITGPFSAEVTLSLEAEFANMDITDLYYPFALVLYSKKDKSFIADPEYIAERQQVEAALRLGAARIRKRQNK